MLSTRNSLTQRSFGPECSGTISIDVSGMKDGDVAGLAALQRRYGLVGVKMTGNAKSIVMVSAQSESPVELASVPLIQNTVFLKIDCDFRKMTDKAYFAYSLDGQVWTAIGKPLQMAYTVPHFMGYRCALFNYHCAPQVFYFRPQQKWYLIYQSQHPQFSTTTEIDRREKGSRIISSLCPGFGWPASRPERLLQVQVLGHLLHP